MSRVVSVSQGGEAGRNEEKKGFSRRQWILLGFCATVNFFTSLTISMQAPFYPEEAEMRGATGVENGFVYGTYEFVVLIASPIFGKYMSAIGPTTVLQLSSVIIGPALISFGFLGLVTDRTWFVTLSFICRILQALGGTGIFAATFVTISCAFPKNVATLFASLQTFVSLGFTLGPTIGGAFYGVGGFSLPFYVVGSCFILAGALSPLILPKPTLKYTSNGTASIEDLNDEGYGIGTILRISSIALASFSMASTAMGLGYVGATLESHTRQFQLTSLETGLVFAVNGVVYAVTAPLWGMICDRIKTPIKITLLSNLFVIVGFVLIGPIDFIPGDTVLWVTIVGLAIQGLGFGSCFVSAFSVGLQDSMKHGLPNTMATYAVVSGLWQCMIALGVWVGPSVGGVLVEYVGFREGSWLFLATALFSGLTITIYLCFPDYFSRPLSQPLLPRPNKRDTLEMSSGSSYGSLDAAVNTIINSPDGALLS